LIKTYIVFMVALPPEIITLFEWLVAWIFACTFVLAVAILAGPLIGGMIDSIFGWFR
jgi:hypothetical protein